MSFFLLLLLLIVSELTAQLFMAPLDWLYSWHLPRWLLLGLLLSLFSWLVHD